MSNAMNVECKRKRVEIFFLSVYFMSFSLLVLSNETQVQKLLGTVSGNISNDVTTEIVTTFDHTHATDTDPIISSNKSIDANINTTALHHIICNDKAIQFKEWKALCDGDTNIVQEAVDMLTKDQAEITITQIGAHVGFEPNDPMASGLVSLMDNLPSTYRDRFHWTFVEPSPPNYARLVDNLKKYEDVCDMSSMNVAVVSDEIGTTSKDMVFYSIRDTIDPETGFDSLSGKKFRYWISQISSFSKEMVLLQKKEFSDRGLNIDDYIVETNVATKSFSGIMADVMDHSMNNKKRVAASSNQKPFLTLIDTEGYDCDIVLGISPDSKYLPKFIVFEVKNCINKWNDVQSHLEGIGYDLMKMDENAIGILRKKESNI
ncbi:hypothetical protein CTEN210_14997 [Chaetoceros tenuissimus]|uniref:Methyltransferase FkbM domain-containing protein n=1 Tax=Chaetoceros tenuissimus TaxID=426638 RepID=A0AAD3D8A1_9STRA|nr:hypothetical protein CTEN210_14997 [Chaetoceros tenuissimus]